MWKLFYPVLIIVASNVLYNVCTKSTPSGINAFASLFITYALAAIFCLAAFFLSAKDKNVFTELSKANWATLVLGVVIVGLEIGYILAYRNGWKMNTVSVTANISLAVILIFVALIFYKETITLRQIGGIALCAGGLLLISI